MKKLRYVITSFAKKFKCHDVTARRHVKFSLAEIVYFSEAEDLDSIVYFSETEDPNSHKFSLDFNIRDSNLEKNLLLSPSHTYPHTLYPSIIIYMNIDRNIIL